VAYSLSIVIIQLADRVTLRLPLEPVFVIVAAVYNTLMLGGLQQTIGKMLLGLGVTLHDGKPASLKTYFLREVIFKWFTLLLLPPIIGRILVGGSWIPTLFDFLAALLALLYALALFGFTRKMFYDLIAGTKVIRVSISDRRKITQALLAILALTLLGIAIETEPLLEHKWISSKLALLRSPRSLAPYTTFLQQPHPSPQDYVIQLFDKYDIVVICERSHAEETQWKFIFQLVSDPRFIDHVGHVFTEYGNAKLQPFLNEFMATPNLSDSQIHERLLHIMRNLTIWPVWNIRSFYDYLGKLYRLNQKLTPEKQIKHYFCDDEPLWDSLKTKGDWWRLWRYAVPLRDQTMASGIIAQFKALQSSSERREKALVIMNYRHAFGPIRDSHGHLRGNCAEFLFQEFPDRIANVLLNTNILLMVPIQNGSWDLAFKEVGNQPIGFSFAKSPFGSDPFDYLPYPFWVKGRYDYADVFTGFVFLNPLDEQLEAPAIPGFYKGFENEVVRRADVSQQQVAIYTDAIAREKAGILTGSEPMPHPLLETWFEHAILVVLVLAIPIVVITAIGRYREAAIST
jgi:uncharacterized RDD family membrane protein YckC